jgi:methylthioribose-1-phosphate isomerase
MADRSTPPDDLAIPPRTALWYDAARGVARALDQSLLPHETRVFDLADLATVAEAIRSMRVRGAPLIGVAAAFGLAAALADDASAAAEAQAAAHLVATRPTAVNLAWAVARVRTAVAAAGAAPGARAAAALAAARALLGDETATCEAIGAHGLPILERLWAAKRARDPGAARLDVLTHCNAGWLATGEWGTALAPVYRAHGHGLPVHVWVDETRPRAQGASLTAWELGQAGVPHTLLTDTMAGHVMQRGMVDVCLVGSDRTTAAGDVCNKIGTYLVALAAHDNGVPFYACVPTSSLDGGLVDGVREVVIEERDPREVTHVRGITDDGTVHAVRVPPAGTEAANFAFDVTPARLVTGIVTEHGVFPASREGLAPLLERPRVG